MKIPPLETRSALEKRKKRFKTKVIVQQKEKVIGRGERTTTTTTTITTAVRDTNFRWKDHTSLLILQIQAMLYKECKTHSFEISLLSQGQGLKVLLKCFSKIWFKLKTCIVIMIFAM